MLLLLLLLLFVLCLFLLRQVDQNVTHENTWYNTPKFVRPIDIFC
jgi:hypothetical protein